MESIETTMRKAKDLYKELILLREEGTAEQKSKLIDKMTQFPEVFLGEEGVKNFMRIIPARSKFAFTQDAPDYLRAVESLPQGIDTSYLDEISSQMSSALTIQSRSPLGAAKTSDHRYVIAEDFPVILKLIEKTDFSVPMDDVFRLCTKVLEIGGGREVGESAVKSILSKVSNVTLDTLINHELSKAPPAPGTTNHGREVVSLAKAEKANRIEATLEGLMAGGGSKQEEAPATGQGVDKVEEQGQQK